MRNIKEYVRNSEFKLIIKNNQIYIENYTNIGNISESNIEIYNNEERILIKGKNLRINKLLKSEILIQGKYTNISFGE